MEDSLFTLSPDCAVANLLLDDRDSLFNDSLDANDPLLSKMATSHGTSDTSAPDLNDSLDFDSNQLPFNQDTIDTDIGGLANKSSEKNGFELAPNIPVFQSNEEQEKASDVSKRQTEPGSSPLTKTVPSPNNNGSTNSVSKVVPSFGKRKTKSTKSPRGMPTEVNNSTPIDSQSTPITNIPVDQNTEERDEICGDQCVPQTTDKPNTAQKPSFTAAKKKTPATKKTAATIGNNAVREKTSEQGEEEEDESRESVTGEKKIKTQAEKEKKKQEREQKRRDTERKREEREQKKLESEAKKAERERLKKEKQLEQEKKKAEREQKKIEQALKNAERMASKENRDRKKKEGAGDSLKKNHTEPVKHVPEETLSEDAKNQSDGNSVLGVTEPEEGASLPTKHQEPVEDAEPATASTGDDPNPQDADLELSESSPRIPQETADEGTCNTSTRRVQPTNDTGLLDAKSSQDLNSVKVDTPKALVSNPTKSSPSPTACSVSVEKLKIVFGKAKQRETQPHTASVAHPGNQDTGKSTQVKDAIKPLFDQNNKQKNNPEGAKKKKKPKRLDSSQKEIDKLVKKKGKKRRRSENEDEEESFTMGPVWVQCERSSCKKWRKLRGCSDPLTLPDSWTCSMNTDPERNRCSAKEESWSDEVGENQEFVETSFIPGSLVWAKMDSYPWWPAMVEDDPDDETYYKLGKHNRSSNVPVKYHVVFFDNPVSRGWISSYHVAPYHQDIDRNFETGATVPQKLRAGLKDAKKMAKRALSMNISTRLIECSFSKRFRRSNGKRCRKTHQKDEEQEIEESCYCGESKCLNLSPGSVGPPAERSSARLSAAGGMVEVEKENRGEEEMEEEEKKEEEEAKEGDMEVEENEKEDEVNLRECVNEEVNRAEL